MASSVIGALRVNLGMNSAEFTDGVKNANKSMARFGRNMASIAKTVATVFAGIASGAAVAFGATSKAIADLYSEAETAGVSFEAFQKLKVIADENGVSIDALTDGMKELNLRADEFISTGGGSAKEAFERLGFSAKELSEKLKQPEELLADIIGRLEGLDTAAQIRIADEIFGGTGGEQFVRLLSQGADGIRSMASALDDYGIIVSEKAGRQAKEFQATLSFMKTLFVGMANQLTVRMLPTMQYLADQFIYNEKVVGALKTGVDILAGAFNGMVRVIMIVINNLDTLYKLFKIFVAAQIARYVFAVAGSFIAFAKAVRVTGVAIGAFSAIQRIGAKGFAILAGVIALSVGQLDNLSAAIDSVVAKVLGALPEGFGKNFFGDIEGVESGIAGDVNALIGVVDNARNSFQSTSGAASNLAKSVGSIGEKSKDAWSGLREVSESAKEAIKPVASTFQNAFGSWIDQAVEGTFKFKDAIADLGKQLIKTFANRAIQQLFGSLLGGAGGASLAVGGMSLPGFANGGSFNVGGAGGVDSQIVAFRASPNEDVHITKPGQSVGGSNVHVSVSVDDEGALQAYVTKTSANMAGRAIGVAAPAIVEQSKSSTISDIGTGSADGAMGRFGAKPQARQVG